ncbi:hypothetical protein SCP_0212100 [Sparassis crispa]|uniref:Uncharacterized protein n=1 Tax=Sparassis crispa TaxID=139825 RepID=A0A401GCU5_9APHY|nr:hypothetical protein SCP_0212100 [Sparassis crispa]GBE80008.1 hypothetical protein SCP_0212100 [Sparassis crispa]
MWKTALLLLGAQAEDGMDADDTRINFLTTMMRQHADERESILKELVLQLIHAGQYRKALDELELFLPSLPYQDNPVLHVYAGLICLYLAQPKANALIADELSDESGWNAGLLREAQGHFERAKAIDADNTVATTFLEQLPTITNPAQPDRTTPESDDEDVTVDDAGQRRKRIKT